VAQASPPSTCSFKESRCGGHRCHRYQIERRHKEKERERDDIQRIPVPSDINRLPSRPASHQGTRRDATTRMSTPVCPQHSSSLPGPHRHCHCHCPYRRIRVSPLPRPTEPGVRFPRGRFHGHCRDPTRARLRRHHEVGGCAMRVPRRGPKRIGALPFKPDP
jgi:hypothetical protein